MWNGGRHYRDDGGYALALGIAQGAGDVIRRQNREIAALRELNRLSALKADVRAVADEAQALLDTEIAKKRDYQRRAAAGAARMLAARTKRNASAT